MRIFIGAVFYGGIACVTTLVGMEQQPLVHFRSSDNKSFYFSRQQIYGSCVLYEKDLAAQAHRDALLRKISNVNQVGLRLYQDALYTDKPIMSFLDDLDSRKCRLLTNVAGKLKSRRLLIGCAYYWLGKDLVNTHIRPLCHEQ